MEDDFPTFEQFRELLKDDCGFKDHFNLFLQLPVFAKRFHYSSVNELFDISPYPSSNFQVVDHHSVWQWIYTNRLPVFWRSELFYGYRLCFELNNSTHITKKNLVVPPNMAPSERKPCTPKELQKFILFLRSSPGEAYYLIWLHLDKLYFSKASSQQKTLIAKIKELFLVNGAPFQLEVTLRKDILFATSETSTLKEEIESLLSFQNEIFTQLKTYWYEKYLIACANMKDNEQQVQNKPELESEEEEQDDDLENELKLSQPGAFVDHGDESITINVPQEDFERTPVTSHKSIEKKNDMIATQKQINTTLKPYPSKSTYNLFSLSTQNTGTKAIKNDTLSQKLMPFVQASIRCTFAAGNPLLDYLSRYHNDEITRIRNHILFWESTELILTSDEMRRWYNGMKGTTDVACPYLSLFDSYPLATDLETLLELYIDDSSDFYVNLPAEMQRQLLILLPKGLGHSLLIEVQDYACRVFEPFWAKYILQDNTSFLNACVTRRDLSHLVDAIQIEQSQIYHESLTIQEVLPSTFDCTDTQSVKKMWYAVEYVEVLENPGFLHLPSRLAMELYTHPLPNDQQSSTNRRLPHFRDRHRVPTPGDIGPITYRGLTLTPMVTTIESSDYRSARRHVRTTIYSSKPAAHGDMKKKPVIPENFNSMMRNPAHLENFYHFLCTFGNGIEINLIFWLAVEDMKDFIGEAKLCATKIRRIMRRFFKDVFDITVHCQDSSLLEIASTANPTPFQLMDAQEAVAKLLEARWYEDYLRFLTGEYFDDANKSKSKPNSRGSGKEEETGGGGSKNNDDETTSHVTQQSKITWRIFTRAVVGFRRGLMDPKTLNLFKKFLTIEVLNGDLAVGKGKKMIGRKMVNVTKLLNDLSFWAEVERFKDMADVINAAKDSGNYTPEDEIMIHKKAHAIVNCYIDSSVAPKIQINVSQDIVAEILDNMHQGYVNRSLFHKAAVHIFAILILYWKRFLLWRWAPKSHSTSSSMHSMESSRWSGLNLSLDTYDSQMMLDGCILSFSLRTGLRLVRPISREKPITIAMPSFNRDLTQSTVYRLKQSYQSARMNRQSTREMINVH